MIVIVVRLDLTDRMSAFSVMGHAGAGPAGQDIVCAAVSVLTQTAVLAVEELGGVEPLCERKHGRLRFRLPPPIADAAREKIEVILAAMLIGLRSIAAGYPDNLVVLKLKRRWKHAICD